MKASWGNAGKFIENSRFQQDQDLRLGRSGRQTPAPPTCRSRPAGYPIRPDRVELDQLVFRIERLPDTVQSDHVDWGFNVTNVYGLDYRYTIMKGILSD